MPSRDKTISDQKERINRVLLYISENISGPLSLETLSEVACFSMFHFHRLFHAHVGETLNGYVRRVRLERAALRLSHTKESVTDISLSAGYETPAAFAKAFRLHFGKTPSEYKRAGMGNGTRVKLLDLNAPGKKRKGLKPEIRIMPEQRVLFVRKTGRYDRAAKEAWSELMKFAYPRGLIDKETRVIGISHDCPEITSEDKLRYDACITMKSDITPERDIGIQTISDGRYAAFLHEGPYSRMNETYNAIFSDWLPESGEMLRDVPCFDVYLNHDPGRTKPDHLRTEIYIPVV